MKDGQLENTGVRMLIGNADDMTKRQLVKLLRSRQGPDVFLYGNDLYKVEQAQEEAIRQDVAMCEELLARARTHDVHAADIGGGRRVALMFGAHRADDKNKRAPRQYLWRWLLSEGGQEFRDWYFCAATFKRGKASFKAYAQEGYLPNEVKTDSLDSLIDQAVAILYHCSRRHCLAFDLERTTSGNYFDDFDSVDDSRILKALQTGNDDWTREEVELAEMYNSALSRNIHNRLDAFMARVEDDA